MLLASGDFLANIPEVLVRHILFRHQREWVIHTGSASFVSQTHIELKTCFFSDALDIGSISFKTSHLSQFRYCCCDKISFQKKKKNLEGTAHSSRIQSIIPGKSSSNLRHLVISIVKHRERQNIIMHAFCSTHFSLPFKLMEWCLLQWMVLSTLINILKTISYRYAHRPTRSIQLLMETSLPSDDSRFCQVYN